MKRLVACILVCYFQFQLVFSQDVISYVETPKGSTVTAWITEEQTASLRHYYDSVYSLLYPENIKLITYDNRSSSRRFNCHGYAWYMTESEYVLNDPRWIGYQYSTDEDIYMTDGSYIQVASEIYPGKVSWGSSDHSAITTSESGIYISKWNQYPLFKHSWDNTPYGTANLKYYAPTMIEGDNSILCNSSNRVFSVASIPNASYNWTVGNGLSKNENGNSVTVTSNSSYSGESYVGVTITSPLGGGQYDIKSPNNIDFWIGKPSAPVTYPSSPIYESVNTLFNVSIIESPGADPSTGIWETICCVTANGTPLGAYAG